MKKAFAAANAFTLRLGAWHTRPNLPRNFTVCPARDGFAAPNLIQAPSRIKRGSRHVPLISIID
jgi:hypothetical protein